jgi:hypothetical protein
VLPFRHWRWLVFAVLPGLCVALLATPAVDARRTAPPCFAQVRAGVLPSWVRTGFHPPTQPIPHELGRSGRIVAIVFGFPLLSPPSAQRSNKILWVSRQQQRPGLNLRIGAQRMDGREKLGPRVTRIIPGGAGPSIVDLPEPGCWRLTLRWSGQIDTLDLEYVANRRR